MQLMPIFDPVSEAFLGCKPRADIHRDGDWHRGVQAFVVRPNAHGSFDTLVQMRSDRVDIGRRKYDQSLATQMTMEDCLDEDATLRRGLREELNITKYASIHVPVTLRIVKTYEDDAGMVNRELISLHIVATSQTPSIPAGCHKIAHFEWMEWEKFLAFFDAQPRSFTKTGQFYLAADNLRRLAERYARTLLDLPSAGLAYVPAAPLMCIHHAHEPQIITTLFSLPPSFHARTGISA